VCSSTNAASISTVPARRQARSRGWRWRSALSGQCRRRGPRFRLVALSVDAGRASRTTAKLDAARLRGRVAASRPRGRRSLPRVRPHPPASAAHRNRKLGVAWKRSVGWGDCVRGSCSRATRVRVGRGTRRGYHRDFAENRQRRPGLFPPQIFRFVRRLPTWSK